MKKSSIWSFIGDNFISLATIIAGIGVIIINQFFVLPTAVITSSILALLTLLATSEIVDSRRKLSNLEEGIINISDQIKSEQKVKVIKFQNSDEALDYLAKRLKTATQSVEQASLDLIRSRDTTSRENFRKSREQVIMADRIKYRYIGVLYGVNRLEEIYKYISKNKLKRPHLYFAGFYLCPTPQIPMMNFVIFDRMEVFARTPYSTGQDEYYLSFQCPEIAEIFLGYFEKIWDSSIKVENQEDYNELKLLFTDKNCETISNSINPTSII
jgi:hypothetical protein